MKTLLHILAVLVRLTALYLITAGLVLGVFLLWIASSFDGTAELPADCGLVFGAAVHGGGEAGPGIERRVQTAARLYEQGMISSLTLSGGKGSATQESEAAVMQKVAIREGVNPNDIQLEMVATSTIENLTFAKPMMEGCSTVVGISDRYHLARIEFLANRMNWKNFSTYPADRIATPAFEKQSLIREALAIVYTMIFGLEAS